MVILKDYQNAALTKLMDIYHNHTDDSIPLFSAPTGAGKTIMSGSLVNQILTEDKNTCFVWISIGKSGLHEQSRYKVEKFFPKLNTLGISEIISQNKQELNPGDILFLNWESVSSKSKKTGEWLNIFMRSNEHITLPVLMYNTHMQNLKVVLIIDEAHSKGASVRGNEVIKIISPYIIFNVTATPRKKQYEDAKGQVVKIHAKDVMDEGVIKKSIVVNKGIRNKDNVIIDLLETAHRRREQLLKLYKQEGVDVNPLCLIQLPNGAEGFTVLEEVTTYLRSLDKTEENGKVAVWLTEDKVNLESIESITAPQEYLIFKQAIDTGWDCPRAQILVKYRDIQSEVFKEQIIGRILRMPELKHYKNPVLNDAYIFTNESNFTVDKPEEIPESIKLMTESIPLKSDVFDKIVYTVIPSFSYIKLDSLLNKRELMRSFVIYLHEHLEYFEAQYNIHKDDLHLSIPIDLIYNTVDGVVTSSKSKDVGITASILKGTINQGLKKVVADEKVRSGLIDYMLNMRPEGMSLYDYLGILAINLNYIMDKIDELITLHTSSPTVKLEDIPIVYNTIPASIPVKDSPVDNPTFSKLLYMWYPYKTVGRQDKIIIDELEQDDSVEWWFYNRTFAYAIGIPAIIANETSLYKPRFITKRNNKITVIDYTKDESNYKEILRMLELWRYYTGLQNIDIDLRYLDQKEE